MAKKKPHGNTGRKRPDVVKKNQGNKYAEGCTTSGAPEKWTQELLAIEAKALREWAVGPRNLWLKGFAYERGYIPQMMAEFAQKSTEFALALQFAKNEQERKFIHGAWSKEMDINFVKFFMPRMLLDRPEWKSSWDQPDEKVEDKPTTVIINEIRK